MGQTERAKENARDNKREKSREARRGRNATATKIDVAHANWVALAALVTAATDCDGAVRVGLTRDGGAWALGMYVGDDYATEYVRPNENFTEALGEIASAWFPDNGSAYFAALQGYERDGGVQTGF